MRNPSRANKVMHIAHGLQSIVACIIIIEACYTKFVWVKSAMTTSTKVRKLFLVMKISIRLHVWQGNRWDTSIYTWAPLCNAIATLLFQSISWAAMCSLLHRQCSKWIPKSSMVWSHWHHEICATVGCDISRRIRNAIRKWAKDKTKWKGARMS